MGGDEGWFILNINCKQNPYLYPICKRATRPVFSQTKHSLLQISLFAYLHMPSPTVLHYILYAAHI